MIGYLCCECNLFRFSVETLSWTLGASDVRSRLRVGAMPQCTYCGTKLHYPKRASMNADGSREAIYADGTVIRRGPTPEPAPVTIREGGC